LLLNSLLYSDYDSYYFTVGFFLLEPLHALAKGLLQLGLVERVMRWVFLALLSVALLDLLPSFSAFSEPSSSNSGGFWNYAL
jgi:hypothetical protein